MKGSITGYVFYALNEIPMPNTEIKFLQIPERRGCSTVLTNAAGYFMLQNVEEGKWTLSATSPTGEVKVANVSVFDNAVSSLMIEFAAQSQCKALPKNLVEENTMISNETGSIRGRVLRLEDETPLKDVAITILRGQGAAPDITALTNKDGCFELDGLCKGDWVIAALGPKGGSATASVFVTSGDFVETLIFLTDTSKEKFY